MTATEDIKQASVGFDFVFSNDLDAAKSHLSSGDSPFHIMGMGCVVFLQAALGMETGLMTEASRLLTLAEAKAKKEAKAAKSSTQVRRFAAGLDFEVLQADAILLLGLTQALIEYHVLSLETRESYTGYLQCMYSLNSAHTKFTKIYKIAFPDGVDSFATPSTTPVPSRKPSPTPSSTPVPSRKPSSLLVVPNATTSNTPAPASPTPSSASSNSRGGFFSRWNSGGNNSSSSRPTTPVVMEPDGPVEELIISGAAFGFGLFNLVLSLLPAKVRGVVGFFGFNSDRRLALRALAVAATKNDVHAVFAGLTLMSYHGAVLLLSGYQADEAHILKQYRAIVNKLEGTYPSGSLWILNRAKILRMSYDPDGAISVLQTGLAPERPHSFVQADALLVFELAWTLLAQRRYQESADMFMRMTELNTWSHATYYFIAAGCYISLGNTVKAKELLDEVPVLLEKRKLGGRDLPTEVFIRKKIAFYKQKQERLGGEEADYVNCIRISLAEELGIFWNVHDRITRTTAEAHVREWLAISPPVTLSTPYSTPSVSGDSVRPDLDTADEFALRSLLLGVVHRSLAHFTEAREFLLDAAGHSMEAKWMRALAYFELAALRLREADATIATEDKVDERKMWTAALQEAGGLLDKSSELSGNTDLSSRLDSRISLMRDEIALKKVYVDAHSEGKE